MNKYKYTAILINSNNIFQKIFQFGLYKFSFYWKCYQNITLATKEIDYLKENIEQTIFIFYFLNNKKNLAIYQKKLSKRYASNTHKIHFFHFQEKKKNTILVDNLDNIIIHNINLPIDIGKLQKVIRGKIKFSN